MVWTGHRLHSKNSSKTSKSAKLAKPNSKSFLFFTVHCSKFQRLMTFLLFQSFYFKISHLISCNYLWNLLSTSKWKKSVYKLFFFFSAQPLEGKDCFYWLWKFGQRIQGPASTVHWFITADVLFSLAMVNLCKTNWRSYKVLFTTHNLSKQWGSNGLSPEDKCGTVFPSTRVNAPTFIGHKNGLSARCTRSVRHLKSEAISGIQ